MIVRADDIGGTKPIINRVWELILRADLVVADLTTTNPNVFYEIGLTHVIGNLNKKKILFLTQDRQYIPFDLRSFEYIIYNPDENVDALVIKILKKTNSL